jgi:hypothetical protein
MSDYVLIKRETFDKVAEALSYRMFVYGDDGESYNDDEVIDALERLKSDEAEKLFDQCCGWLPVSEGVPNNVEEAAGWHWKLGAEMVTRRGGQWFLARNGHHVPDSSYTHWLPLNKPPRGER